MLKRKTPLARSIKPLRRTPLRRSTERIPRTKPSRASQNGRYSRQKAAYLEAHPFDQIKIAMCGFREADVLARGVGLNRHNCQGIFFEGQFIPIATQIHHRNKGRGERLLDERWWMATADKSHDHVESFKNWAREEGYLLPIQADADGKWGMGNQALETPAFMEYKIR